MSQKSAKTIRITSLADCFGCPARHVDLFAGEDRTQREHLVASFRIGVYAPKESIYRVGEVGESVFLVRFGLIKLVRHSSSGTERIVQLARTGDTIGMTSLLREPYHRTAIAMSNTEVCRVPAEFVLNYNRDNPDFLGKLLAEYQANLDAADTFLTELSTGSARARVARLLLFLTEKHDHGESPLISREEMGSLLGLTTETASRVMAEFRREGVIKMIDEHHDRCHSDVAALAKIATD